MPLADYLEDVPQARASRRKARVQGTIFASARLAQSSPPTVVPAPPPPEPESAPAATTPQTTTTTTTPQPPPVAPSSPPGSPGPPSGNQLPPLPSVATALLVLVEEKPLHDVIELPTGGFKIKTQYVTDILTDDGNAPAGEVRRVLTSTRLQIANPTGAEPKLSPLGVVVNFSAQIDGYRGKESVVRWSLFNARERTRMPQSWLRNRVALRLIPEAGSDRGSPSVWVPLPRRRGPYFVRLELLDDRGNRLDKADTKSFDR